MNQRWNCDVAPFQVAHSKLDMHCFSDFPNLYMSLFSCVNDPSGSLESPGTIQSHCGCDPAQRSTSSSALQSWISGGKLNILNWICESLRSVDSHARILYVYACMWVYIYIIIYTCIHAVYYMILCVCMPVCLYIFFPLLSLPPLPLCLPIYTHICPRSLIWTYLVVLYLILNYVIIWSYLLLS